MKNAGLFILILLITVSGIAPSAVNEEDWGFYAHRKINELAVFTLPVEMLHLYKSNIDYIEEHAVDPDKRRYASVFEGIRHYIDLDQWENELPIDSLPRDWARALCQFTSIFTADGDDTVILKNSGFIDWNEAASAVIGNKPVSLDSLLYFFRSKVMPLYYTGDWQVESDTFSQYFGITVDADKVYFMDHFSEHGVLPYHLEQMQRRLTRAFEQRNFPMILRLSAEMGHYIGDAHVPLHTSKNYNGQLTGQVGIHAFWESRIPELFAEDQYDFFVDRAKYQSDKKEFFWRMITSSHALVDSVLLIERRLRKQFPKSEQMCFDERLGRSVLTQCKDFAQAYQNEMDGMVEERMRSSIHAIGSSWYTAWVDAGQPDLREELTGRESDTLEQFLPEAGKVERISKRPHTN